MNNTIVEEAVKTAVRRHKRRIEKDMQEELHHIQVGLEFFYGKELLDLAFKPLWDSLEANAQSCAEEVVQSSLANSLSKELYG